MAWIKGCLWLEFKLPSRWRKHVFLWTFWPRFFPYIGVEMVFFLTFLTMVFFFSYQFSTGQGFVVALNLPEKWSHHQDFRLKPHAGASTAEEHVIPVWNILGGLNPPRLVQALVILSCGVFSTVQNHHFLEISWTCSLPGLAKQDLLSVEFSNFFGRRIVRWSPDSEALTVGFTSVLPSSSSLVDRNLPRPILARNDHVNWGETEPLKHSKCWWIAVAVYQNDALEIGPDMPTMKPNICECHNVTPRNHLFCLKTHSPGFISKEPANFVNKLVNSASSWWLKTCSHWIGSTPWLPKSRCLIVSPKMNIEDKHHGIIIIINMLSNLSSCHLFDEAFWINFLNQLQLFIVHVVHFVMW